ncbi:unnamed protein product, partial [Gongylonema pulchrum]|uniref:Uncharacterized protein n=1 Tax=Gongylonema pulchrum TaxID=637853 RepID=A0A183DB56_9BILA
MLNLTQAELESETVEFSKFRKTMIDRQCDGFMLSDGEKDYFCKAVDGTPLTIGFVSYRRRNETVLNASVQRPVNPRKDLVGHYVPKRGLCRGDLDHVDMMQRFNAFLESKKCEMDTRLPYALVASLNKWTESWPELAPNATCSNNPLPPGFDPLHHITSFVNTFNHITAFYPRWF